MILQKKEKILEEKRSFHEVLTWRESKKKEDVSMVSHKQNAQKRFLNCCSNKNIFEKSSFCCLFFSGIIIRNNTVKVGLQMFVIARKVVVLCFISIQCQFV